MITKFPDTASTPIDRVLGFMAHLRLNGVMTGIPETGIALQALEQIRAFDPREVRLALRAVCTGTSDEYRRFDDLFDAYWRRQGPARDDTRSIPDRSKGQRSSRKNLAQGEDQAGSGTPDAPEDPDADGAHDHQGQGRLIGSRMRNLSRIDLRELVSKQDIEDASLVAERLANAIVDRRSRRQRASKCGMALDLRKVARSSLGYGGEPIRLHRKQRRIRRARLVALCDVSGSMTVYARVFLAFLKGLMTADLRGDAYLVHTKLVRITDALRDRDTLRAVGRLSLLADGFGGGTKIGSNLSQFNKQYAKRYVDRRSVVIILSDGYDTDPPAVIGSSMADLKKRGCRIIWLNPLKGWRDYQPVAGAMAEALPYIDHFAAANTLESLAALESEFARL